MRAISGQTSLHKTRQERLSIPGLAEMRVDMIVVSCILIRFIIDQLNIAHIDFSPRSLKTGLFLSVIEALQQQEQELLQPSFNYTSAQCVL